MYHSDYIAFLESLTDEERRAWRTRTDSEREIAAANGTLYELSIKHEREIMARKPNKPSQALKLAEALDFVSVASRDTGEGSYQTHVVLSNKWAARFDGIISAGFPIEEDLQCCPHAEQLLTAITKCGKSLAISQLDNDRLSVKGDKLRALVPCIASDSITLSLPDPNIAKIDDRIKDAFNAVGKLVSEAGTTMLETAVLLQANSVISTNRTVLIEFWHGIDLPPNLVLPKLFISAICKQSKPLAGFGFSDRSVTFYFDDGSWIKTQRYEDEYPNVDNVINHQSFPVEVPKEFYEAVEAVATFNEYNRVYFRDNKVCSEDIDDKGAQYELKGSFGGKVIDSKLLAKVKEHFVTADFTTHENCVFFFSEKARGVVMCIASNEAQEDENNT